jgi:hypothetical protein
MLTPEDISVLRQNKKDIRFCPNCSSRKIIASALVWKCSICTYRFLAIPADCINKETFLSESETSYNFLLELTVASGKQRPGIGDLVSDSTSQPLPTEKDYF